MGRVLKANNLFFQGCFRQNVTVVTIYASLGEDALVHSLNEVNESLLITLLEMQQAVLLINYQAYTNLEFPPLIDRLKYQP